MKLIFKNELLSMMMRQCILLLLEEIFSYEIMPEGAQWSGLWEKFVALFCCKLSFFLSHWFHLDKEECCATNNWHTIILLSVKKWNRKSDWKHTNSVTFFMLSLTEKLIELSVLNHKKGELSATKKFKFLMQLRGETFFTTQHVVWKLSWVQFSWWIF